MQGWNPVEFRSWATFLLSAVALLASPSASLQRQALFIKGAVVTSREQHLATVVPHSRLLAAASSNSSAAASSVWVLGLSLEQQDDIHAAITGESQAEVLYALPAGTHPAEGDHHWLIRAGAATVNRILATFPDATAALLPDNFKLSPSLDRLVEACAGLTPPYTAEGLPMPLRRLANTSASGQPTVLLAALVPDVHPARMETLLAWLPGALADATATGCGMATSCKGSAQSTSLTIRVCLQDVPAVVPLLAALPEVTYVDVRRPLQLLDLHAAAQVQAPESLALAYPAPNLTGGTSSSQGARHLPLWAAGLDGTGQVVGVVDSGLDMDSCYVWDPEHRDYLDGSQTARRDELGGWTVFQSDDHRKVAMYVFREGSRDDTASHGTHVATSIVGSVYGVDDPTAAPDEATGIAPGARVAVYDVGPDVRSDDSVLIVNEDELQNVYKALKEVGAHVTSNSWGYLDIDSEAGSSVCELMDAIAWEDQTQLHVFAAGNKGTQLAAAGGASRISTPAVCKNMMAVGATENFIFHGLSLQMALMQDGQPVTLPADQFLGPSNQGFLRFMVWLPMGITTLSSASSQFQVIEGIDSSFVSLGPADDSEAQLRVVVAQPPDACSALDVSATFPDGHPSAVLVIRKAKADGRCTLWNAVRNALRPNLTTAVLLYEASPGNSEALKLSDLPPSLHKPTAAIGSSLGTRLAALVAAGASITVAWLPPDAKALPPMERVAEFSSFGAAAAFNRTNTTVGRGERIKPDLVAPGYVLGGRSDGEYSGEMDSCDVVGLKGTSMATPQVAGAALLVRAYFQQGFYPLGAASSVTRFDPSGPLLRAVLTAGAVPMARGVSDVNGQALSPAPSRFQGFGRAALSRALPLQSDDLGWNLQLVDNAELKHREEQTYTFQVTASDRIGAAATTSPTPLIVTLCYADYKGYGGAGSSSLVNDLDLMVEGPIIDGSNTTARFFPNGLSFPDPDNTVERVVVDSPATGTWHVTVTATRVFAKASPARYALVVLGGVSTSIASPWNPASGLPLRNATARSGGSDPSVLVDDGPSSPGEVVTGPDGVSTPQPQADATSAGPAAAVVLVMGMAAIASLFSV